MQQKPGETISGSSFLRKLRKTDDEKLPPNWGKKVSPEGKGYYFNIVTDETTWNLNEVDWETGLLVNSHFVHPVPCTKNRRPSGFVGPIDLEGSLPQLSWARLTANIVLAIHRLNHFSKRNIKEHFIEQASEIVEAVRIMFVSSRTESMDSPILNAHPMLRAHHHHVFNSLCHLVLSAQYASIIWCSPDAVNKMEQYANEVLLATRHFITAAQDIGVVIRCLEAETARTVDSDNEGHTAHHVRFPGVVGGDPGPDYFPDQHDMHTDLLTELLTYSGSVTRSINQLIKYLVMGDFKPVTLVAFARQTIMHIGQLMTVTDDVEAENAYDQTLRDFKYSKQAVYNSISALVGITRRAAENVPTENILEQLLECAMQVEQSAKELIVASKFVIHEKGICENRSLAMCLEEEMDATGNSKQKEKLKKFFGDDTPSIVVTKNPPEEKAWYLEYEYVPSDIVFNMEGRVKGGTLVALVERLTLHDLLDSTFIATFLLTYRSFTTTEELFELLFERFDIQAPPGLTTEQLEIWTEKKLVPIRLRVFNIMKSWLESYYLDSEDDFSLEMLRDFAQTKMQEIMSFASNQLIKLIDKRMAAEGNFRKMVLNMNREAPPPILPRNMRKLRFLEIDPMEIARQFTILDSTMYNRIRPVECLNKAWSQKDASIAINIKAMIEVSNQVTNWVTETVLLEKEVRKRVAVIKHFISIGEKCRNLNNFNTLTAILAGLNSAPIHRLKRTWELINARSIGAFDGLKRLMNSTKNFGEYREELHSANPPCVPFLGLYLTDLTFVEDGNPDHVPNHPHLINIAKRAKCAEVIREIQQYQNSPYNLTMVPEIQAFIQQALQKANGDRDLYAMSLHLEPKECEDEKIARLLHESGFL
ncbi:ras GEF [Basidiobolus meristosporus CBS 931.73]|uniref:Ras GEF n=1 Tax=Basidiobolus meristosporus CBS 931.73 TaxID=1314790 RepID=A0A1Y1YNP2_9FUNG|nr:ras GEF [Basidiobolus meristosporus CBS 931.73]|eukprot:ORX99639.1 ras GEF [Basidiobolus meristosporus CBS 931.73]